MVKYHSEKNTQNKFVLKKKAEVNGKIKFQINTGIEKVSQV